ncbi:MoaD/ThiS family protein [Lysobacter korlensis]|uniref:MoaD/ThiS family protein n=1 Tax=Lysobacter korlensis TaxID=553636 RepID=A0ABV6RLT3_9GAMM
MNVHLSLYGAFRQYEPAGAIELQLPDGADIAQLRDALSRYASEHWPDFRSGLLTSSAFASEASILRDREAVPPDGRVAVLPPVSGG